MSNMRRIYHLQIIATNEHLYFGSLVALHEAKEEILNISLSTLQHYNFDNENYETENYIIRKGQILTANDVRSFH